MLSRLLALAAGAACVFGFAPFSIPLVTLASLGVLFYLWSAQTARAAALIGFWFGAGLFGVGTSWVYIALETFGGMPPPVAVTATASFVALLALCPALAGWLATRFTRPDSTTRLIAMAAAFTASEWFRSYVLTGFPWLAAGYAELPADGPFPLAGYAPTGGVFLVSLMASLCAAGIAGIALALADARLRRVVGWLGAIAAIVIAGALQLRIEWTVAQGSPVAVSLIQGNVSQDQKFDPAFRPRNYELYADLVRLSKGRIVVLPESAYPQFADEIPNEIFSAHAATARTRDGVVLIGLFVAEPGKPGEDERIYNSVVSMSGGQPQLYRKRHLVPFGETIPLKPITGWFINKVLAIPLSDQTPGPSQQPPFDAAGERIAVNICYEDAFGAELVAAARAATLLVNVTNDAWYDRSIAARQHNQISAMRALETGRPMLRATNTGITSAIGHDGRVIAQLPWFTSGILEVEIAGRSGETPYLRFGDWPALMLALALFLAAAYLGRARNR